MAKIIWRSLNRLILEDYMKLKMLLLGSIVMLNGCAIMSKNECLSANWGLIGQNDGYNGNGSFMQKRTQACMKHNAILDTGAYTTGYKKGLKNFCNPQTIFDYALQGRGTYQSCPMEMQNSLRPYYNVAHNFYNANKNLKSIEDTMVTAKSNMYNSDLKEESRKYYRERYDEASNKLGQVQREYNMAEREILQFKRTASFE
ncbi:DUF2799 domain-containing protein [Acinetobacter sp. SFB]|uniref:DUF2799 domain-containing protein n=1 Tax=Acinetobacter sp. SFB TaxID=1805634 RepID=UPI002017A51D|nr:DUF2799 domain-containing protein [Acinetobacter sp. SFB]